MYATQGLERVPIRRIRFKHHVMEGMEIIAIQRVMEWEVAVAHQGIVQTV